MRATAEHTATGVTGSGVRQAAARLAGVVVRTPLLTSAGLSSAVGADLVVKAECLQVTGAFKFRGAYHHLSRLSPEDLARGVVGASSGNHAQALALAAQLLGAPATVVVPADIPEVKLAAIDRLGADVVTYERDSQDRDQVVAALSAERGLCVVPSANSVAVMVGAGTVALELLQDAPDVDTILVPVGGGGLAAGCAAFVKATHPRVRVIGVEPYGCNDTQLSLHAKHSTPIAAASSIADGLRHNAPAPLALPVLLHYLDDVVTVHDDAITEAMALGFEHLKVVLEPSGAIALAALLSGAVAASSTPGTHLDGRMGVVLSGGNVDWATFGSLITRRHERGLPRLHRPG
jgi:threonine dehydratase